MARSTLKADALVLASRWDAESREQGDGMLDAAVGLVFNSRTYDLDLEVRPPSGAAFRVTGRYKSPSRLGGITKSFYDWRIVPGMTLPVLLQADGLGQPVAGGKVEIDWAEFADNGGIQAASKATKAHRTARTATALGQQLQGNPKQYDTIRASVIQAGPAMAANVASGAQTRADFETWLLFQLESRVLSAQEAHQLWAMAGLEGRHRPRGPSARACLTNAGPMR